MAKRKRITLIIVLTILFLIVAPLAISYSLGWRFDWQEREITRPGIFFFKTRPNSAEVFINQESKDKTDFFFGSVVIENLLPKKYQVEIKKEDYHSWKKTLEIKRGEVTEAKNIVLIPKNPNFEKISQNTKSFYYKDKEIVLEENGEKWSLKLYNPGNKVKSHLADQDDFSKNLSQIVDVLFLSDNLLIKLFEKESFKYYLLERNPLVITTLSFLPSPEKVLPVSEDIIFFLKEKELKKADISKKEINPLLENIISFEIEDNKAFYLDSEGFLFENDLSFQNERKLNQKAFPIKKETEYTLNYSSPYFFLKEKDSLYLLKEGSFEKISDKAKEFKLSPDKNKLAYFNNGELWIYFLEDTDEYPKKKSGDKVFITRLSEKINNVFWYTNHYLIFSTDKDIKVTETDDRDKINIVSLAQFNNPDILWKNNNIYLLSENNFYYSEKLIP